MWRVTCLVVCWLLSPYSAFLINEKCWTRTTTTSTVTNCLLNSSCFRLAQGVVRLSYPGFDPWVGKIPWKRAGQPTPVFLPGESPWTEEFGRLQSMGLQRSRHNQTIKHIIRWRSVQFSSVTQLCSTVCDPMYYNIPGFPVHHQLPELTQIHVHQVGDAIQSSRPLLSSSPSTFSLS